MKREKSDSKTNKRFILELQEHHLSGSLDNNDIGSSIEDFSFAIVSRKLPHISDVSRARCISRNIFHLPVMLTRWSTNAEIVQKCEVKVE